MLNQYYKEMLSLLLENEADFLLVGDYALAIHGHRVAARFTEKTGVIGCQSISSVYRTHPGPGGLFLSYPHPPEHRDTYSPR